MSKYASYDTRIAAPSPVTGWYDFDFVDYPNISKESLIELTAEQWANRMTGHWAISNGAMVAYDLPVDTRSQARFALASSDIIMHRLVEAVSLGETTMTAPAVVAFATWRRELRTIAAGTDATAPLPVMPPLPIAV